MQFGRLISLTFAAVMLVVSPSLALRTTLAPICRSQYASPRDGQSQLTLLADKSGSVQQIVDEDGGAVNQYDYDAFGNIRWENSVEEIPNRYTFQGREWGANAGHYNYRIRPCSCKLGVFSGPDLNRAYGILCYPIGIGNYLFCINTPLMYFDPLGLKTARYIWRFSDDPIEDSSFHWRKMLGTKLVWDLEQRELDAISSAESNISLLDHARGLEFGPTRHLAELNQLISANGQLIDTIRKYPVSARSGIYSGYTESALDQLSVSQWFLNRATSPSSLMQLMFLRSVGAIAPTVKGATAMTALKNATIGGGVSFVSYSMHAAGSDNSGFSKGGAVGSTLGGSVSMAVPGAWYIRAALGGGVYSFSQQTIDYGLDSVSPAEVLSDITISVVAAGVLRYGMNKLVGPRPSAPPGVCRNRPGTQARWAAYYDTLHKWYLMRDLVLPVSVGIMGEASDSAIRLDE